MDSAKIAVVGSANMDVTIAVDALPLPGQTVLGGPPATAPGGKGANQAVAAARAGGEVVMVGGVGHDPYGAALVTALEAEGVDISHVVRRDAVSTGIATILVERAGNNQIVVSPGANAALSVDDVVAAADVIGAADVLLVQFEVPMPAVAAAIEVAAAGETIVIVNPAPAVDMPAVAGRNVDVLVPNETEMNVLAGRDPGAPITDAAVADVARRFGGVLIVTLGAAGVVIHDGGATTRHAALPAAEVVDATAAGDAFIGAFAVSLGEGNPLDEAVRWGMAAGALAVGVRGAQPSLPMRDQIVAAVQNTV